MLNLFNSKAQIDLSVIQPEEIAKLDDNAQAKLAALVEAVTAREAAQARYSKAMLGVGEATVEQSAAMAAHIEANPAPTFNETRVAAIEAYRKSQI